MITASMQDFMNNYELLLSPSGSGDCIAGVMKRQGQAPIVCYAREAVLTKLRGESMTGKEALEFFDFNIIGDMTPCFLVKP